MPADYKELLQILSGRKPCRQQRGRPKAPALPPELDEALGHMTYALTDPDEAQRFAAMQHCAEVLSGQCPGVAGRSVGSGTSNGPEKSPPADAVLARPTPPVRTACRPAPPGVRPQPLGAGRPDRRPGSDRRPSAARATA